MDVIVDEFTVKVYKDRIEWLNKDGQLHRIHGPAVEYLNGDKEWWIKGEKLTET